MYASPSGARVAGTPGSLLVEQLGAWAKEAARSARTRPKYKDHNTSEVNKQKSLLCGNQDLLALSEEYSGRPATEETINDPTVRKHYWRYRCHVALETLRADKPFLAGLQQQLLSARAPWTLLPLLLCVQAPACRPAAAAAQCARI
jgi:hypothetical protein